MKLHLSLLLAIIVWPLQTLAVGFERVSINAPTPIQMGIWYPSDAPVPKAINSPFRQALALNAKVSGDHLPLVILSHGYGGWMGGHADAALELAEAGYIVAAPEHPGNNSEDESASTAEWLVSRPADIATVIDFMLQDWPAAEHIAADRIGVYGFSAGGYTALVAAGAVPDFLQALQHCENNPQEFTCEIGMLEGIAPESLGKEVQAVAGDGRIKAISVAAPGLSYMFDESALAAVNMPVQLWSGAVDVRVPHASNGANLAAHLPNIVETHIVEKAGHFAFMAECNPKLKEYNPRIWNMVCVDAEGFDRGAFHEQLNSALVNFFDKALAEQ